MSYPGLQTQTSPSTLAICICICTVEVQWQDCMAVSLCWGLTLCHQP